MIIWLAMLIPLIGCAVAFKYWSSKFVWWEMLIPTVGCFLFILITKFSVEKGQLHDIQYRGGLITEARYYEYWSTWHVKECSKQVKTGSHYTGSGKNRHKVNDYKTVYYDCSECDTYNPYWEVYDNQGHSWRVSEGEYNRLKNEWKSTPEFVDQHRSIRTHFSCGQDGDMYRVKWDGQILSSETSTWETSYDNHIQMSRSSLGLKNIDDDEAKELKLYEYPVVNDYTQGNILGLDSMSFITQPYKNGAYKMFNYFNGYNGPIRKIRVYILLFNNRPLSVGHQQKSYWIGGNKNEVVICIDVDKNTGKINWVYPFTWAENRRIEVDLREDISNLKTLNFTSLYDVVDKSTKNFVYRDFEKFNYLAVDPPTWEVWLVYILTLLITVGTLYYGYQNEFEN